MRWLWLAFISLGGYGRVAFVSVLLLSAMRLRHARGKPRVLYWFSVRCVV